MVADYAKGGAGNAVCALILVAGLFSIGIWVSERFISVTQASEFATKADAREMQLQIAGLQSDVKSIKTRTVERDLINAQERFCDAWRLRNVPAQRYAIDKRRELANEFHEEQGREYALPTCEELGYVNTTPP